MKDNKIDLKFPKFITIYNNITGLTRIVYKSDKYIRGDSRLIVNGFLHSFDIHIAITHTVGSYNMSFAGDLGLDPRREAVFESEGTFHLSNTTGNLHQFWINALNNLCNFWLMANASVVGLQEINKTPVDSNTGSGFIESEIKATLATRTSPFNLACITEEIVVAPYVKPALMILWNEDILGAELSHVIADLDFEIPQKGRPILLVLTLNGYLLINCHAPNHAELSKKTLFDLRVSINNNIDKFLSDNSVIVDSDKIFIMGDFNDRYDALQSIKLTNGITLTYSGKAPLSCCHNWDSSCSSQSGRYRSIGTCDSDGQPLAGKGVRKLMGDEGNIENYRYYGDKVFGFSPKTNIQIFPQRRKGASKESDHEMVIAEYESLQ